MVLGVLLMLAGTVGFFVASYVYGTRLVESAGEAINLRANLVTELDVPERKAVTLESEGYRVVAFGPRLTRQVPPGPATADELSGTSLEALPFSEPQLTVVGPDGELVRLDEASADNLADTAAYDAVVIGEFTITEPGTYTISTRGASRDVTSVGVGTGLDIEQTVDSFIGGALVVAATIAAGGFGFLLLLGGIIWFAVRGSSSTQQPPGPLPPPPGYGPPP